MNVIVTTNKTKRISNKMISFTCILLMTAYVLSECIIVENMMASARKNLSARGMISDFLIQNFVKDMNFTIKNMVKRSPVLDKTNMATLGYLSEQMSTDESEKLKKKGLKFKIKNLKNILKNDEKSSHDEEFMRTLSPLANAIIKNDPNPLLVFINKKSGGRVGSTLLECLKPVFSSAEVCDLSKHSASEFLKLYSNCTNLRILICGGDGTVGWVMDEVKKVNLNTKYTYGIIPLGTGNDLCLQLNQLIPIYNKKNENRISENVNVAINESKIIYGENEILEETAGGEGGIIGKNYENFIINLLPETVIANPEIIKTAYKNPEILKLDRWGVKMQRVHGRKRKILKMVLKRNKIRNSGILKRIMRFFTKWWYGGGG